MMHDSKSLFNVYTKPTTSTEKRLTVARQTVKDAYNFFEASDITFKQSNFNISKALTKVITNSNLFIINKIGKIDHSVSH